MTEGTLGIIACPMLEDELLYGIKNDPEGKSIYLIENKYYDSVKDKMESGKIPFTVISKNEFLNGAVPMKGFSIVIEMNDLGLHAEPKELMKKVEDQVREISPAVDAVGLYYGLCGNYGWNMTQWAQENGLKPTEIFRDHTGRICDDCVGVAIGGGERYLELQKNYTGMFYVTPAIAHNWKPFLAAGSAGSNAMDMSSEIFTQLGIHDEESYIKWMFTACGYQNMVKMDTGIERDKAEYEREFNDLCKTMELKPIVIGEGWMTIQPAEDLYRHCKDLLKH